MITFGSLINILILLTAVLINVLIITYFERKMIGFLQIRFGPTRTGPRGVLQPLADALKLLTKEDIIPTKVDKLLFIVAPAMVFVPAFIVYMTVPFTEKIVVHEINIGIFYIMAILSLIPVGIIIGGWASDNKYSLLGCLRAAAQQISYEVPMILAIIGVILLSGTLNLREIVLAQKDIWFIFLQPIGFIIYFIAVLAELNRTPFDMPEAESELVAGYNTEYSGMKFALFFLAEYSNLFLTSALAVCLFFGGWLGPILPPLIWFIIKTYTLMFVVIWVRGTLPRVRIDHFMDLGWKILLPTALVWIMITGLFLIDWS